MLEYLLVFLRENISGYLQGSVVNGKNDDHNADMISGCISAIWLIFENFTQILILCEEWSRFIVNLLAEILNRYPLLFQGSGLSNLFSHLMELSREEILDVSALQSIIRQLAGCCFGSAISGSRQIAGP